MRFLPLLSLPLACAASLAQDPPAKAGTEPPTEDKAAKLVATAREKLAAIGYQVPAAVTTATRTSAEVVTDLDAQQDLLFPRDAFLLQHALLQALGQKAGKDAAALRGQTVAAMARGLSAYYDPLAKRFVLLPSATRTVGEALAGSALPLVVHELVHACQDARGGGLADLVAAATATFDSALVARMVLEGEAEVAAIAALRGEAAIADLAKSSMASSLDKLFAGELTGLLYEHGRQLAAQQHAQGGFRAVQGLWSRPPSSSEQVLHPAKTGRDEPRVVALPTFPGCEPLATSTLGELLTYHLLRTVGHDTLTARLATAGWDGDRVTVLKTDAGTCIVWRSVWDRPRDAEQFAACHAERTGCLLRTDGRCVDLIGGGDVATRERLAAACAASPGSWPDETEDAASTAAEEAAIEAKAARNAVHGDRWELRDHELSIPVPEGFERQEVQGMAMLVLPASTKQGFTVNVNVQVAPRGPLADVDALLAANRAQLEGIRTLTLVQMAPAKIGDHDVVRVEFHGRIGAMAPIHCLQILYLHGENQVVVTATASLKRWSEYEATLRSLMDGVAIGSK